MLGHGTEVLAELFPGFTDELVEAGVPALDYHDMSEAVLTPA